MLRGYRCIIVAFVGWLSLAAGSPHPTRAAKGEQVASSPYVADSLGNIATAYDKQTKDAERSPISQPCEQHKDNRLSDLCAQWKAADAADTAAWWARVSGVLSVAGLLGVAGALSLTVQSNRIARKSSHAELRPYIYLPFPMQMMGDATHGYIREGERANVHLKNFGKTPALKVRMYVHCVVRPYNSTDFPKARDQMDIIEFGDVPPDAAEWYEGQNITGTIRHRPALIASREAIHIDGVIEYEDSNGVQYYTNFRLVSFGEAFRSRKFMKSHHGNTSA